MPGNASDTPAEGMHPALPSLLPRPAVRRSGGLENGELGIDAGSAGQMLRDLSAGRRRNERPVVPDDDLQLHPEAEADRQACRDTGAEVQNRDPLCDLAAAQGHWDVRSAIRTGDEPGGVEGR